MSASRPYRYIESVQGLGTTWYYRGFAYCMRRVGFALLFLLVAAGGGALSGLLLYTIWTDVSAPVAVKIVVTLIAAAAAVWSAVATQRRAHHQKVAGRSSKPQKRRGLFATTVGLVGLARTTALGLVVLGCSFFVTFGAGLMLFVYSLGREFGDEHQARLRDQKRHTPHTPKSKREHKGRRARTK